MLYQLLLYSEVNQPYMHIDPLPFRLPSNSGHHSTLHMFSLVTYIIHSISSAFTCQSPSPNSSHHLPFTPWHPYICSLHLCLYFCFANKIIYTMFLNGSDEPIYRAGIETQTQKTDVWTQYEGRKEWDEFRVALKYIHYHM